MIITITANSLAAKRLTHTEHRLHMKEIKGHGHRTTNGDDTMYHVWRQKYSLTAAHGDLLASPLKVCMGQEETDYVASRLQLEKAGVQLQVLRRWSHKVYDFAGA